MVHIKTCSSGLAAHLTHSHITLRVCGSLGVGINSFGYYNKELVAHWLSSINLGLVASGTCCMASMSRGGAVGRTNVLLALLLCSYRVGDSG